MIRRPTLPCLWLLLCLLPGLVAPALAGERQARLGVTAEVVDNCSLDTTAALDFGAYDPAVAQRAAGGTDLRASAGALTIACTRAASATVLLGAGGSPAAGSTDGLPLRQLQGAGHTLAYQLYQDAAAARVWGNTPASGLPFTGSGHADVVPVYGVIPRGQVVPAGSYADLVVVTITF